MKRSGTSFVEMMDESVSDSDRRCTPSTRCPRAEWDWQGIGEALQAVRVPPGHPAGDHAAPDAGKLRGPSAGKVKAIFEAKTAEFGDELMDHLIKVIMLQVIDIQWKDHLLSIDHLKEGIGLRGYGQKDPKQEYKKEAFQLFINLIGPHPRRGGRKIFWVQLVPRGRRGSHRGGTAAAAEEAAAPLQPGRR